MASASRRRFKRESMVEGLMTPEQSVHSMHTRTISPKPEPIDLTEDLSDEFEVPFLPSHHGLPVEDEGYLSQVVKPQRSSTSSMSYYNTYCPSLVTDFSLLQSQNSLLVPPSVLTFTHKYLQCVHSSQVV